MSCIQAVTGERDRKKPKKKYKKIHEDEKGNTLYKKKHSQIIVIILMAVFLTLSALPSVNAEKVNQDLIINIQCTNSTYSNITSIIYKTNSTYILKGEYSMTKSGTNYNYTLPSNLNNKLGILEVNYHCNVNGQDTTAGYLIEISPTGSILTDVQVYIYIFFLIICLFITFFSFKLFKENKENSDKLKDSELYQMKKRNEFLFYTTLLKRKLWIVGIFGIYLSTLIFISLLDLLVYNLGIYELDVILRSTGVIMLWGLIPFILFWLVWLIFTIYKSTVEIMKYQLGNFRN